MLKTSSGCPSKIISSLTCGRPQETGHGRSCRIQWLGNRYLSPPQEMLQSLSGASAGRSPAELWISLFLPSALSPVTNSLFNLFPSPFSFVFFVDCIMVPKCSLYPDPSPCAFSILPTRGKVSTFYPLTLGSAVQLLWPNEMGVDMRQTVASSIPNDWTFSLVLLLLLREECGLAVLPVLKGWNTWSRPEGNWCHATKPSRGQARSAELLQWNHSYMGRR